MKTTRKGAGGKVRPKKRVERRGTVVQKVEILEDGENDEVQHDVGRDQQAARPRVRGAHQQPRGVVIQQRRDGEGQAIPGVPGGIEKQRKRHQHGGPKGIVARREAIKQAGNQRKQKKDGFNESHKRLPEEYCQRRFYIIFGIAGADAGPAYPSSLLLCVIIPPHPRYIHCH